MQAPKCAVTVTCRAATSADPRTLPELITYACDRQTGDRHMVHHDPTQGLWRAILEVPKPGHEHDAMDLD